MSPESPEWLGLSVADWVVVLLLCLPIILVPVAGRTGNAAGRLVDRIRDALGLPPHPLRRLTAEATPPKPSGSHPPPPHDPADHG